MNAFLIFLLLAPQVAEQANEHYQSEEDRARMIRTLSAPERAERIEAEKLVREIGIEAGWTVADLGTGGGVLVPLLADAVGPDGKVLAEDIHPDYLDAAREAAEGRENVEYVLGNERDPNLPEGAVDVAIAVDAYHHFNYPEQMLAGIRRGLKPDGRLVVVDYYKEHFRDPEHIRLDKPDVIREIEANGFELLAEAEHVPEKQYRLEFRKARAVNGPLVMIIGPPSSGKSTQAALVAEEMGVPVISVEQLIKDNSEEFNRAGRPRMGGMEPESDPVLNHLFERRLERGDLANGGLLDGYPSTKDHADFLAKMVQEGELPAPVIIELAIPDDVARQRALNQPGRTPEAVDQRLKDYHREMDNIRLYFPNADVTTIDGMMNPKKVTKAIRTVLKKRFSK